MDILYWIKHNPDAKLQSTTKLYFCKFLCKVSIFCPGGRSIYEINKSISIVINRRIKLNRELNFGGSWIPRNNRWLAQANIPLLEKIRELVAERSDKIRIRVEEPYIHIYSTTEQHLKNVIDLLPLNDETTVASVHIPKDQMTETLLLENKIIKKSRRNSYQFKISLREGRLDLNVKEQLLNYLDSLGDQVKLPPASRRAFTNKFTGFWGVYFYTNDTSITTFLELISPGITANINEIVVVK